MTEIPVELVDPNSPKLTPFRQETPLPATLTGRLKFPQISALQALASGMTPTEAAEHVGAHRSQLYLWAKSPAYSLALDNAHREHYAAMATRFHTLANNALDALEKILNDPKASPNARIKAASMVFDRMERAQPAMPQTSAQMSAIDEQCRDENAPHLVVGRKPSEVTNRDAEQLPGTEPQTTGAVSVTDRDAKQLPETPPQITSPECVTDRDENRVSGPQPQVRQSMNVTDRDENCEIQTAGIPFPHPEVNHSATQ